MSRTPSIKPKANPPNEEYCPVAICNPLAASYHSSGSGGSANKSLSTSACRNAVCTSIAIVIWSDPGSLFLSCEFAASIVFRDSVDGVGENISGCVRPWHWLWTFKTNLDFTRPSLDLPILFESLFCQLPQTFSRLSSHPFLSVSSALSSFPSSLLRDRQAPSTSASWGLRWDSSLARSRPRRECLHHI